MPDVHCPKCGKRIGPINEFPDYSRQWFVRTYYCFDCDQYVEMRETFLQRESSIITSPNDPRSALHENLRTPRE